jgi:hypothetical protein
MSVCVVSTEPATTCCGVRHSRTRRGAFEVLVIDNARRRQRGGRGERFGGVDRWRPSGGGKAENDPSLRPVRGARAALNDPRSRRVPRTVRELE